MSDPASCVCVPARDEASRLPALIAAIAAQNFSGVIPVMVALNNCTDESADNLHRAQLEYRGRVELLIDEHHFPPELAHAGAARRRAMDLGADRIGKNGVLLSTDADARPPPDWLTNNLRALERGVEVVGGRLVIDGNEALPPPAAALRARVDGYWRAVREIEDAIDPVEWDLPPRHGDHTGASLAMTARSYRAAGGVPLLPSGEDRALVRAVLRNGGRLAHPPEVWVLVSPRRQGRAAGGMALAMQRLHDVASAGGPLLLPDFRHWRARAVWRRNTRASHGAAAMVDLEDALPPMPEDMDLTAPLEAV